MIETLQTTAWLCASSMGFKSRWSRRRRCWHGFSSGGGGGGGKGIGAPCPRFVHTRTYNTSIVRLGLAIILSLLLQHQRERERERTVVHVPSTPRGREWKRGSSARREFCSRKEQKGLDDVSFTPLSFCFRSSLDWRKNGLPLTFS